MPQQAHENNADADFKHTKADLAFSYLVGIIRNSELRAYAELGISATLVHPREVFKAALIANSHGIIVAHNHPAGSLTPSQDDLDTTTQLIQAGKILGVEILDHIIVSSNGLRSLRETEPQLWW